MYLPEHSPTGGSGMFRWDMDACPGSVLAELEAGPDVETFPSQEGTAGHELAAVCINNGLPAAFYIGKEFNRIVIEAELADHVQGYVDFARAIPGSRFVEWRFHLDQISQYCHGTLDLAHIDLPNRIAYLTDLKLGRVVVSVENNLQLMYYAVALVLEHNLVGQVDHIVLSAYQPRIYGRLENFESWTVTPEQVIEWANNRLVPSINLALSPEAPRKAGTHCRDCRAKLTCSAFLHSVQAAQGYAVPMTNENLAHILTLEKPIKNLIDAAQKEATTRLQAGQNIPGFKPVRSYGQSRIINPDACAADLLAAGITDIFNQKLKGITELKKDKRAVPIVTRHAERLAGGIKAAPISSTQPAVSVASEAFAVRAVIPQ